MLSLCLSLVTHQADAVLIISLKLNKPKDVHLKCIKIYLFNDSYLGTFSDN